METELGAKDVADFIGAQLKYHFLECWYHLAAAEKIQFATASRAVGHLIGHCRKGSPSAQCSARFFNRDACCLSRMSFIDIAHDVRNAQLLRRLERIPVRCVEGRDLVSLCRRSASGDLFHQSLDPQLRDRLRKFGGTCDVRVRISQRSLSQQGCFDQIFLSPLTRPRAQCQRIFTRHLLGHERQHRRSLPRDLGLIDHFIIDP